MGGWESRDCSGQSTLEKASTGVETPRRPFTSPTSLARSTTIPVNPIEPVFDLLEPFLHTIEPYVNLLKPRIHTIKPFLHAIKPFLHTVKPLINLLKPRIHTIKPLINLLKPLLHTIEPFLHTVKPLINLLKPCIHTIEPLVNALFETVKSPVDSSEACRHISTARAIQVDNHGQHDRHHHRDHAAEDTNGPCIHRADSYRRYHTNPLDSPDYIRMKTSHRLISIYHMTLGRSRPVSLDSGSFSSPVHGPQRLA